MNRIKNLINENLMSILNRNNIKIQNTIMKELNKPISASDGYGYIYGFVHSEYKTPLNYKIKLGRTIRNPYIRVENEWNGIMVFCIKTRYNHKLERLIHLFYDYSREYRIKNISKNNIRSKTCIDIILEFFNCICYEDDIIEEDNYVKETEWFNIKDMDINDLQISIIQINKLIEEVYKDSQLNNTIIDKDLYDKINLNTATEKDLMKIQYIGKQTASNIIKYRKTYKFKSIDEIKQFKKELDINFDRIKNNICI